MDLSPETPLHVTIENYRQLLDSMYDVQALSKEFADVPADEKVSFAYDMLLNDIDLPRINLDSTKSSTEASHYRVNGNKAFSRKRDIEALELYTKSIAYAPTGSEELALAYANRSAVCFKLGKFDSCVADIDRALVGNYPEALKPKLYDRKEKCNGFMSSCDPRRNEETKPGREKFPLPTVQLSNEKILNASEKVKVECTDDMGRHLIAGDDINPGEVLAIETPYASVLLPKQFRTHCSNCFVRTISLIPCDRCSMIMFCSERCRDEAFRLYHRIECQLLPTLVNLDIDKFGLLSVRILMIASNQSESLNELMRHPIYGQPICEQYSDFRDRFVSSDYFTVHNLADNFFKRTIADLFRKTMEAACLLHLLMQTSFFRFDDISNVCSYSSESQSFVGTLLLKYVLIGLSNSHEISELVERNGNGDSAMESLEIGAGLYPLLSLANHACDPNVTRHCHNNRIVFRALQPIAAGEQLFDNYGYHYATNPLEDRQKCLRHQYYFECYCRACENNWPLYLQLSNSDPEFLDSRVDVEKVKNYMKKYENTPKDDLDDDFLCEYLSLLYKNIKLPWKEYSGCQERYKRLIACKGNCYFQEDITL